MSKFTNIFRRKIDLYPLISHQKVDELEAALKSNADPNQLDKYGQTPIFRVVYNPTAEQVPMLKLLLQYGADVSFRKKRDGETVIHNAGSIEVAKILLQNEADITIETTDGRTPLHKTTSAEMARFFIDQGIDVDAKDNSGSTPLFDAVYWGLEIVECLLMNGAAAEVKNDRGWTPLMCLAQTEYADETDNVEIKKICDLLIKYGAKVDSTDHKGNAAFQHALSVGNQELADYLRDVL